MGLAANYYGICAGWYKVNKSKGLRMGMDPCAMWNDKGILKHDFVFGLLYVTIGLYRDKGVIVCRSLALLAEWVQENPPF